MAENTVIVVDSGIPWSETAFSPYGDVRLMAPSTMNPASLRHADILIVRSVVKIGKELLNATSVRFIGSATAGTDHVDQKYLKDAGIGFESASGANADSVADYVTATLLLLSERKALGLSGLKLGVIGCGEVGTRVARRASALGMHILRCDPPRQKDEGGDYVSLAQVMADADVVSLHVPLTHQGTDSTFHMLDSVRMADFSGWLINTSRGPVVDTEALLELRRGGLGPTAIALDVWEGEPRPSEALVSAADIATPHIAGYADDSKWNATQRMSLAIAGFLGRPAAASLERLPDVRIAAPFDRASTEFPGQLEFLGELALAMCPIQRDDVALRGFLREADPGVAFARYRSNYPGHRLMRSHTVTGVSERWRSLVQDALGARLG
ncbi:MAG: erythronate-4-phosphate dehydrogenase [Rhodothermales bacterium]|jgi:erythronate-4-phosphate dehydrogenase